MRDGAHTAVMAAARTHAGDVEVVRAACGALWNLAYEATDNKVPLFRDGVHTAVMAAARTHADDVGVARAACGALQSLATAVGLEVSLVRDGAH